MPPVLQFLVLLTISNTFMTIAWYGHLKYKSMALWAAILVSWLIALAEYVFQVPANRAGSKVFTLTQLKISQECITLLVFVVYAYVAFKEVPRWNTLASMACVVGAVYFAFIGRN